MGASMPAGRGPAGGSLSLQSYLSCVLSTIWKIGEMKVLARHRFQDGAMGLPRRRCPRTDDRDRGRAQMARPSTIGRGLSGRARARKAAT
jgi:hypothetical protein